MFTNAGNSTVNNGGVFGGTTSNGGGIVVNGTIALSSAGSNVVALNNANLSGGGAVVQMGENDVTNVGSVAAGIHFRVDGMLALAGFHGTIGPSVNIIGRPRSAQAVFGFWVTVASRDKGSSKAFPRRRAFCTS